MPLGGGGMRSRRPLGLQLGGGEEASGTGPARGGLAARKGGLSLNLDSSAVCDNLPAQVMLPRSLSPDPPEEGSGGGGGAVAEAKDSGSGGGGGGGSGGAGAAEEGDGSKPGYGGDDKYEDEEKEAPSLARTLSRELAAGDDTAGADVKGGGGGGGGGGGFSDEKAGGADRPHRSLPSGIFIGSLHAAFNREGLVAAGITHILNLSRVPPPFPHDFTYLSIDLHDNRFANLLNCIPAANIFIEAALAATAGAAMAPPAAGPAAAAAAAAAATAAATAAPAGGVLVHCQGGRSRSAAVVAAFLISSRSWSFARAAAALSAARSVVAMNAGFVEQLRAYAGCGCDVYAAQQCLLRRRIVACAADYSRRRRHCGGGGGGGGGGGRHRRRGAPGRARGAHAGGGGGLVGRGG